MKYFVDTEFIERGPMYPLELISVGIVAEDGREFYRENRGMFPEKLSPWLMDNVWPHLLMADKDYDDIHNRPPEVTHSKYIGDDILAFIGDDPCVEFWGYYSDYDWVVTCQLFGDMSNKPAQFPYRCNDLRQALDHEALHHISQPDDAAHNALSDARWIAGTWHEYLNWNGKEVA